MSSCVRITLFELNRLARRRPRNSKSELKMWTQIKPDQQLGLLMLETSWLQHANSWMHCPSFIACQLLKTNLDLLQLKTPEPYTWSLLHQNNSVRTRVSKNLGLAIANSKQGHFSKTAMSWQFWSVCHFVYKGNPVSDFVTWHVQCLCIKITQGVQPCMFFNFRYLQNQPIVDHDQSDLQETSRAAPLWGNKLSETCREKRVFQSIKISGNKPHSWSTKSEINWLSY